MTTHIGTLLRKQRELREMTQQELNRVLSPKARNSQHLSNVERGKCGLPVKHVASIARKLEVPVDTLVEAMVEDYRVSLYRDIQKRVGAL